MHGGNYGISPICLVVSQMFVLKLKWTGDLFGYRNKMNNEYILHSLICMFCDLQTKSVLGRGT